LEVDGLALRHDDKVFVPIRLARNALCHTPNPYTTTFDHDHHHTISPDSHIPTRLPPTPCFPMMTLLVKRSYSSVPQERHMTKLGRFSKMRASVVADCVAPKSSKRISQLHHCDIERCSYRQGFSQSITCLSVHMRSKTMSTVREQ
jgi:hypothetical protein